MDYRVLTEAERKYTFSQSQQLSMQTGLIGYLRADFGSTGNEFWTTWNDFRKDLKTDEFKAEFDDVINGLRDGDVLSGRKAKAFIEGMGGYSIYASSLDGSDKCVRLEAYMADEHGGKDGWKIEKCYVKDDSNREMLDIIAGKFFIAYAPIESEKFLSMPKELARKYEEKFKYPERFYKSLDGIEAKPYKPVSKDMER